jgi:hypothetical protein
MGKEPGLSNLTCLGVFVGWLLTGALARRLRPLP